MSINAITPLRLQLNDLKLSESTLSPGALGSKPSAQQFSSLLKRGHEENPDTRMINKITPTTIAGAAEGAVIGGIKDSATMNKLADLMLSGQQFSPSQLIAAQAVLYRATMGVTAVTKIAEQASGTAKTVLQQNI